MPKRYVLEIKTEDPGIDAKTFNSKAAFGSISAGDFVHLIGEGGRVEPRKVIAVEHTFWVEGKEPVHQVVLMTRSA